MTNNRLASLLHDYAAMEKLADELEAAIIDEMREQCITEVMTVDNISATYKSRTVAHLDHEAFKRDHPVLFKTYTKYHESTTLLVTNHDAC